MRFELELKVTEKAEQESQEAYSQFADMFEGMARHFRQKAEARVPLKRNVSSILHREYGEVRLKVREESKDGDASGV